MSTFAILNPADTQWSIVHEKAHEKLIQCFFIYQIGEIAYDVLQKISKLYDVISTIDIAILNKVADLSRRFGLKIWQAEARFEYSDGHYRLMFEMPTDEVGYDKFDRMMSSLESPTNSQEVSCKRLQDLDELLDRALNLAPRALKTSKA
jgi:hypothetical protein